MAETTRRRDMKFFLKYDGPATRDGRMDAREVGAAMVSTTLLLQESARAIYGPDARLRVDVNADFRRGSFGIEAFATPEQATLAAATLYLMGRQFGLAEVKTLLELLGFSTGKGGGLIGLMVWLRGEKITGVEKAKRGAVNIVVKDGGTLTINRNIYGLYGDAVVREHLQGLVQPLDRPGIKSLAVSTDDKPATVIEKEQVPYFAPPEPPEEKQLEPTEAEELVEVVSPSFQEGLKWRFAQGEQPFFADVLDGSFNASVQASQRVFGKGDLLRVRMRKDYKTGLHGLSVQREILAVLEHIPLAKQLPLGLFPPGEDGDDE